MAKIDDVKFIIIFFFFQNKGMEGERAPTDTMVPSTLVWDEEKVVELYHRIMNVTGDGRGGRAGRSQRSLGSEDVRLVRLMILWKGLPADPPAEVRLQS